MSKSESLPSRLVDTARQVEEGQAKIAEGQWAFKTGVRLGLSPNDAMKPLRDRVEQIFAQRRAIGSGRKQT